jgi:hypothetical protein
LPRLILRFYYGGKNLASLGYGYALSGRTSEGNKILNQLTQLSKRKYVPAYEVAMLFAGLKQKEQAIQWLRKACEEDEEDSCSGTNEDPAFDAIRSDSRFQELVRVFARPQ